MKELEEELTKLLEELPNRPYPEKCRGPFPNYVDGVKDGLTEARQRVRMRISIPKPQVKFLRGTEEG